MLGGGAATTTATGLATTTTTRDELDLLYHFLYIPDQVSNELAVARMAQDPEHCSRVEETDVVRSTQWKSWDSTHRTRVA